MGTRRRGRAAVRVKELYRYPVKKEPAVSENSLILEAGAGICGDCHNDGGERQVALLTMKEKEWMEQQEVKGFCFHKYRANLLLDGFSLSDCHDGDLLHIGSAVLEITGDTKGCYPDLCPLANLSEMCILANCHSFAKVRLGGVVEAGMSVQLERAQ